MIKAASSLVVLIATLVVAAIVIAKMLVEVISDHVRGIDR